MHSSCFKYRLDKAMAAGAVNSPTHRPLFLPVQMILPTALAVWAKNS